MHVIRGGRMDREFGHRVERGIVGPNGEVTWIPEERLAQLGGTERLSIERELSCCLARLDAEFKGRAPLSTRLLLKEALEGEIVSRESRGG
jgi:hypothetical protein